MMYTGQTRLGNTIMKLSDMSTRRKKEETMAKLLAMAMEKMTNPRLKSR